MDFGIEPTKTKWIEISSHAAEMMMLFGLQMIIASYNIYSSISKYNGTIIADNPHVL